MKAFSIYSVVAATLLGTSPLLAKPKMPEHIQKLIAEKDANGDGFYSEKELFTVLQSLIDQQNQATGAPKNLSQEMKQVSAKLMAGLDRNQDGLLTRKQLLFGLRKISQNATSK